MIVPNSLTMGSHSSCCSFNGIVISNMIDAYQSVVAADTGHINVHEAAAIESAGRKVQLLPGTEGKLPCGWTECYLLKNIVTIGQVNTDFLGCLHFELVHGLAGLGDIQLIVVRVAHFDSLLLFTYGRAILSA
jgi:hypothetical protein